MVESTKNHLKQTQDMYLCIVEFPIFLTFWRSEWSPAVQKLFWPSPWCFPWSAAASSNKCTACGEPDLAIGPLKMGAPSCERIKTDILDSLVADKTPINEYIANWKRASGTYLQICYVHFVKDFYFAAGHVSWGCMTKQCEERYCSADPKYRQKFLGGKCT